MIPSEVTLALCHHDAPLLLQMATQPKPNLHACSCSGGKLLVLSLLPGITIGLRVCMYSHGSQVW